MDITRTVGGAGELSRLGEAHLPGTKLPGARVPGAKHPGVTLPEATLPGAGVRLPGAYLGYVGLSAMDGFCTGLILWLGGVEVNPIAAVVLDRFGFFGMIIYKFVIVSLVIAMCERIVRKRPRTAKAVMGLAIGVTMLPVMVAAVEFACYLFSPG